VRAGFFAPTPDSLCAPRRSSPPCRRRNDRPRSGRSRRIKKECMPRSLPNPWPFQRERRAAATRAQRAKRASPSFSSKSVTLDVYTRTERRGWYEPRAQVAPPQRETNSDQKPIPMRISLLVAILAPRVGRPCKACASRYTPCGGSTNKQLVECDQRTPPMTGLRVRCAERPTSTRLANIMGRSSDGSGVPSDSELASYANPSGFRNPEIWQRGSRPPEPPVAYGGARSARSPSAPIRYLSGHRSR